MDVDRRSLHGSESLWPETCQLQDSQVRFSLDKFGLLVAFRLTTTAIVSCALPFHENWQRTQDVTFRHPPFQTSDVLSHGVDHLAPEGPTDRVTNWVPLAELAVEGTTVGQHNSTAPFKETLMPLTFQDLPVRIRPRAMAVTSAIDPVSFVASPSIRSLNGNPEPSPLAVFELALVAHQSVDRGRVTFAMWETLIPLSRVSRLVRNNVSSVTMGDHAVAIRVLNRIASVRGAVGLVDPVVCLRPMPLLLVNDNGRQTPFGRGCLIGGRRFTAGAWRLACRTDNGNSKAGQHHGRSHAPGLLAAIHRN